MITDRNIDILKSKCLLADDYHFIDGIYSHLNPGKWTEMLFSGEVADDDALFLLDGIYNGFHLVDPQANIPIYDCKNYESCFAGANYEQMNNILISELAVGKLSFVDSKPYQIHSLGAVPKPNGSVHHITDCSMPRK